MTTVALIFVALYLTPVFKSYLRQFNTQRYGTETDAFVSYVDETVSTARCQTYTWRSYYVRFQKEDGQVTERMKYVRSAFLQCVDFSETHWIDKPIIPNQLAVPLESLL